MYMYILYKNLPKFIVILGIYSANEYQISFLQELPPAAKYQRGVSGSTDGQRLCGLSPAKFLAEWNLKKSLF